MAATVRIHDKPLQVAWSPAAERELARRASPLLAEMELYFSCLIRKRVRFRDGANGEDDAVAVNPQLRVAFRPVMTETCSVGGTDDAPPLTAFPIVNPGAFVPHWLRLDYRQGQWVGEFGFD